MRKEFGLLHKIQNNGFRLLSSVGVDWLVEKQTVTFKKDQRSFLWPKWLCMEPTRTPNITPVGLRSPCVCYFLHSSLHGWPVAYYVQGT